jgi:perosamine synthetase
LKFPVNVPLITSEDRQAVLKNLESGWITGESEMVEKFELAFAAKVGAKYGIAVSNGSNALELAFAVLDLKPGDEVILPSFTIISCLAPLLRMGLVPVFVDSDPSNWNMSVEAVLQKISPRTRAILVVHTYGLAVDLDSILQICREKEIFLVEDCAEAHGVLYKGEPCGSFGDISTFSFFINKLITTGEGGMCVTSNPEFDQKLRKLRNLAFEPETRFKHNELGYNFRMTGMQAALGLSQLSRLDEHLSHKREIAKKYIYNLGQNLNITFQPESDKNSLNSFWVVGIILKDTTVNSNVIRSHLESSGVGTRPFFYPLHLQPLLGKFGFAGTTDCPVSEKLWHYGFYVPTGTGMKLTDVDKISEIISSKCKSLGII